MIPAEAAPEHPENNRQIVAALAANPVPRASARRPRRGRTSPVSDALIWGATRRVRRLLAGRFVAGLEFVP